MKRAQTTKTATVQTTRAMWVKRFLAALAVIAVVAYLVPGPAGYANSPSLPVAQQQAKASDVTLNDDRTEALNRLVLIHDRRSDLQEAFGAGTNLNTRALLEWVLGQADSDAKSLASFIPEFQALVTDWDTP
jgi:hypothetical protein